MNIWRMDNDTDMQEHQTSTEVQHDQVVKHSWLSMRTTAQRAVHLCLAWSIKSDSYVGRNERFTRKILETFNFCRKSMAEKMARRIRG